MEAETKGEAIDNTSIKSNQLGTSKRKTGIRIRNTTQSFILSRINKNLHITQYRDFIQIQRHCLLDSYKNTDSILTMMKRRDEKMPDLIYNEGYLIILRSSMTAISKSVQLRE